MFVCLRLSSCEVGLVRDAEYVPDLPPPDSEKLAVPARTCKEAVRLALLSGAGERCSWRRSSGRSCRDAAADGLQDPSCTELLAGEGRDESTRRDAPRCRIEKDMA